MLEHANINVGDNARMSPVFYLVSLIYLVEDLLFGETGVENPTTILDGWLRVVLLVLLLWFGLDTTFLLMKSGKLLAAAAAAGCSGLLGRAVVLSGP